MRLTKPRLCDQIEPRRTQLQKWADAWGREISEEIDGGINALDWEHVLSILQEMRRRIEAGDYSHPNEGPSFKSIEIKGFV